jgi:hypothetical protein
MAHWAAASPESRIKQTPAITTSTKVRIKFDRIIQPIPFPRLRLTYGLSVAR